MKAVVFFAVLVGLLALTCETSAANVKQRNEKVLSFYRQSSSASSSSCQAFNSSCSTCTDHSDCVWCVTSSGHKSCVDGGFFGPSGANDCDTWYNSASCSMKGGDFIIIIASCGGGLILILIIIVVCCCMRARRKRQPEYVPYVPSDLNENRPLTASEQKRQEIRDKYALGSGSYGGNTGYGNSGYNSPGSYTNTGGYNNSGGYGNY